ncbi:hypothetical protein MASR2M18_02630 [Ignavibacteria bacterium]|nr:rhomboid family intramembrane serine protease [Bacteroidota bacterium]MCZ2133593.1 rhomboid family intramembrane serine protease [Bacteroidota bacterium]
MEPTDISSISWLVLLAANIVISLVGFKNTHFFEKYLFSINGVLREREYIRLLSSGFLHGGWMHLAFNMYSFYWFGPAIEKYWGTVGFLAVYFGSLLGGNLLSLYMHRYHEDYRAVGASGAVSGVIFSFILLVPDATLGLMFIPIPIPAWLFGVIYMLISIFGMRAQSDNVGHDAHLGGAFAGVLVSLALQPDLIDDRAWLVALLFAGFTAFIWLAARTSFFTAPAATQEWLRTQRPGKASARKVDMQLQEELNELLDKVQAQGWNNLSDYEQRRLYYLSNRLRK